MLCAWHHGTTFGGNPLACTVASTVINTLSRDTLWAQADPIREAVIAGFRAELDDPTTVTDIRGLGLMIGIETHLPCEGLVQQALEAGVIINVTAGNTLRLLPPLVMSLTEATQLGGVVAQTLNNIQRSNQ